MKFRNVRPTSMIKALAPLPSFAETCSADSSEFPVSEPSAELSLHVKPSPSKIELKRKIDSLTDVVEKKNKKIKVLQQKSRRCKKRIINLKSLVKELKDKSLMTSDEIFVLETVSKVNEEFLGRQLASAQNEPLPNSYSEELRAFALTLHFYSPRAYEYVRQTFNLALPHQRTLCRWYRVINGDPGFTKESFKALEAKIKSTAHQLLFSLVIDEMAIREQEEFDGNKFLGHITLGAKENDDSLPLAKESFVLLLVCINDCFKLPLGYFLTAGISGSQRKTLITSCLQLLKEVGANVISLTFDGLSANLSMITDLGCSLDPDNLVSAFLNPVDSHTKISVFLDPCHMLKLVRNTLGDKGSIIYEDSVIDFKFIKDLHKLQTAEGLHLGNKLRSAHVFYKKQKMKVKLASQLFSRSVADAIEYCRVSLKLPQFEDSQATVEFLRIFNDLFDVLNSRSPKRYGFKKAINKENFEEIKSFLNMASNYISSLKVSKGGISILSSNRRTGFLGFKLCINSLITLAEEFVCRENAPLLYFPTYKISQDHIELFFSCIRFHGGNNNNPSARQFKAAYKKLLIQSELKSSRTGNCIPLSDITILSVANFHSPETVLNLSSPLADKSTSDSNVVHTYVFESHAINQYSSNIIYYIAGFVVKKLQKKLKCEQCISVVESISPPTKVNLITFKSEGKLIYPSDDVYSVCKLSEAAFRKLIMREKKNVPLQEMAVLVLEAVDFKNLFVEINDHQFDNSPLDNHLVHLARAIIYQYLNIRYHYYSKSFIDKSLSDRQLFTKNILFKGQ